MKFLVRLVYLPSFLMVGNGVAVFLVQSDYPESSLVALAAIFILLAFLFERLVPYDRRFNESRGDTLRDFVHVLVNESLSVVGVMSIPLIAHLNPISPTCKKLQELIMIITARSMDCLFIWNAHAAGARREGISDAFIDALRGKQPLPQLPPDEQLVADYVLQSFKDHRVNQSTFDGVMKAYGAQGATELSTWIGYYTMLAFNVNAFEVDLPQDHSEPALPV